MSLATKLLTEVSQNPNGFRPGTLRAVKNEKEIFELLGFPAVRPFLPNSKNALTDTSLIAQARRARVQDLVSHVREGR